MANLSGAERSQYVQGMFARIAKRYDLMNRLMTAGQDVRWRQEVIRRAGLPAAGQLLDLGTGTGDLGREALHQHPGCRVVAADFTLEMMRVGRQRPVTGCLNWSGADAQNLPFRAESFDAVVSGFLLRNVSRLDQSLLEQLRVLRPGGRLVSLDTTRPPSSPLSPLIQLYLHTIIPTLGQWIAGDSEAYTYLPDSTQSFLSAEQLAVRMSQAGLKKVGFKRYMFSTIAIHWGEK